MKDRLKELLNLDTEEEEDTSVKIIEDNPEPKARELARLMCNALDKNDVGERIRIEENDVHIYDSENSKYAITNAVQLTFGMYSDEVDKISDPDGITDDAHAATYRVTS